MDSRGVDPEVTQEDTREADPEVVEEDFRGADPEVTEADSVEVPVAQTADSQADLVGVEVVPRMAGALVPACGKTAGAKSTSEKENNDCIDTGVETIMVSE